MNSLDGPEELKQRLRMLLDTLSGACTIDEACRALGVSAARLHEMRHQAADRELFLATFSVHATREMAHQGWLPGVHLDHYARASIDRVAISRALIDHGFLSFKRRRIPLPISRWNAVKIS